MPIVVGVRFKDSGKIYHFDPGSLVLAPGESVIVETVRGQELAKVAHTSVELSPGEVVGELKPIVRRADTQDFVRFEALQARHDEVLLRCREKVEQHDLPMRLVKAEYSFDGSRLTFYFTAEKRVDFRLLVRDLARTFKARIELRQIGPRDEAKLLGGIGPCGRLLCCATFLPDYARVSIKMAKDQDLPLNPSKISGVCGRLLCCLSYEHEQYLEIKAELPRIGAWVHTPQGPGEVVALNVIKEAVVVELEASHDQIEVAARELQAANEQVSSTARARVEAGVAAPVTRQRRPTSGRPNEQPSSDVLEALELLEQGSGATPPLRREGERQNTRDRSPSARSQDTQTAPPRVPRMPRPVATQEQPPRAPKMPPPSKTLPDQEATSDPSARKKQGQRSFRKRRRGAGKE